MNYDHTYHAGSFTEIFKHTVLMLLIQKLQQKENPYCYIDTHTGYPFYDLQSEMSQKTLAAQTGVHLLWQAKNLSVYLQDYLKLVNRLNQKFEVQRQYYPGSATVVALLKREADVMILNELQEKPYEALRHYFRGNKSVAYHHQDGYQGLKAFLPPKPNRGLVLMDPPFEDKNEFAQIISSLKVALARWPNGIYAVWYPVKSEVQVDHFVKMVKQKVTENCADFRCCPWPADVAQRLSGCGMLIINPPWQIDQSIIAVAQELEEIFR